MGNLNPFNWFGGKDETEGDLAPRGGYNDVQDLRPRAGQIVKISLEDTSFGKILHATSALPSQGYYDLALVPSPEARSDQLIFEFRAWPPKAISTVGNQKQRELTAAIFLSDQTISGIREIVVIGASNQMSRRP